MKHSNKLMEERGALVEELESILDTVASEEREFTVEENERQDAIHVQINDLDKSIQRAKSNEAVFAAAAGEAVSQSEAKEVAEIRGRFSLSKAVADFNAAGLQLHETSTGTGDRLALGTVLSCYSSIPASRRNGSGTCGWQYLLCCVDGG